MTQVNHTTRIFISLGSNIDADNNIRNAVCELKRSLRNTQVSHVYRSPAVGMHGNDFINAAVGGDTALTLDATSNWLRSIEIAQGRVRTANKYADRTLDLDLLLYGNLINNNLPHKEISQQAFVLQPLSEIASDINHPTLNQSILELRDWLKGIHPDKFSALTRVDLGC